jgi:hypothetical protein
MAGWVVADDWKRGSDRGGHVSERAPLQPSVSLILSYFGPWPPYVDLWLRSCEGNPDISWLVVSDHYLPTEPPSNVRSVRTTLPALRDRISDAVGMRVHLPYPYKLCDFKPAYGHVFADEIRGFDFWGHCDADLLFGHLRAFLHDKILQSFNKVLIRGSLALYRNNDEANSYYRLFAPGLDYRKVFTDPRTHLGFDEFPGIARMLHHHSIPFFHEEIIADIRSSSYDLRMSKCRNYRYQAFAWEAGEVWHYYWDGERVRRQSFALIHLQKRRMRPPPPDLKDAPGWYILPDRFIPKTDEPRDPADLRRLNPKAPWRDLTWQILRPYRKLRRLARERALLHAARRERG